MVNGSHGTECECFAVYSQQSHKAVNKGSCLNRPENLLCRSLSMICQSLRQQTMCAKHHTCWIIWIFQINHHKTLHENIPTNGCDTLCMKQYLYLCQNTRKTNVLTKFIFHQNGHFVTLEITKLCDAQIVAITWSHRSLASQS